MGDSTMNEKRIIERKIVLKKQHISLINKEINNLKKQLRTIEKVDDSESANAQFGS
jgi:hypothetical protein